MKRIMLAVVCVVMLGGLALGCGMGPDKAKMEACKTDPAALESSDGCSACCKGAGAAGHSFMGAFGGNAAKCECM
jgi:hypothetical protein